MSANGPTPIAPQPSAVVAFLRERPELVRAMLTDHVDDGTGHCAGCSEWPQARPPVPCVIRYYAQHTRGLPTR